MLGDICWFYYFYSQKMISCHLSRCFIPPPPLPPLRPYNRYVVKDSAWFKPQSISQNSYFKSPEICNCLTPGGYQNTTIGIAVQLQNNPSVEKKKYIYIYIYTRELQTEMHFPAPPRSILIYIIYILIYK